MTAPAPSGHSPGHLTVIYDDGCQLCRRCRAWLEKSVQLIPLAFVASSDVTKVRELLVDPAIVPVGDELVVVGDNGGVWVGPDAFITCLWALHDHRRLAGRLQRPAFRAVAKNAFHALSTGRGTISSLLSAVAPTDQDCGLDGCARSTESWAGP